MGQSFRISLQIFILIFSFHSIGRSEVVENYPFPLADPLVATIAAAANRATVPYETIYLELHPQRKNLLNLKKRHRAEFGLFLNRNRKAPLAFVVSGVGGHAFTGSVTVLAEQLLELGYTAVTMPDPLSWHYVATVSDTARPGYLPRDAKEYYELMKKVAEKVRRVYGLRPQSYSVLGYSFGGLLTGFLMREDIEQRHFDFRRAVLINPAIDLDHGVATLDGFYAEGKKIRPGRKSMIIGSLLNLAREVVASKNVQRAVIRAADSFPASTREKRWVIGRSFRDDLRDILFVSQLVEDAGVLKAKYKWNLLDARMREADTFSFRDYVEKVVQPSLTDDNGEPISTEEALQRSSLYVLKEILQNDQRVYLFENADDFLLRDGDITFLSDTLADRFILYPLGGHVGNLQFPLNKLNLKRVMSH